MITEIGGTVGDIESLPFLEAIRQFALDVGKENCLYIHLTLVPYLKAAGELKTKPTQHSVGQLRQIGIQPDILICRTEQSISREDREKIALFCNVPIEAVIEEKDKDFSIYEVPLSLVDNKLDELIVDQLGLQAGRAATSTTGASCCTGCAIPSTKSASPSSANTPSTTTPTSRSTKRSITPASPIARRFASSAFKAKRSKREGPERLLAGYDGMLVPGGFGERGIEGKVEAIRFARERGIPFFGICLGMQCAVIEFARNVVRPGRRPLDRVQQGHAAPGDLPARRAEDDHRQRRHDAARRAAGAARAGEQVAACYGADVISERHRHRYEFNNVYRQQFAAHGMLIAGTSPDQRWSRSSSCPTIPGSWPCSSIPNSNPSRPQPSRCSPASSEPPWKNTPPANGPPPAADRPPLRGERTQPLPSPSSATNC